MAGQFYRQRGLCLFHLVLLRLPGQSFGEGGLPRKIPITPDKRAYLHRHHEKMEPQDVAQLFDCCVDTAKRILMREGLRFFPGAKYVVAREVVAYQKWRRPCMVCGCTEERPKWQYRCDSCSARLAD